MIAADLLRDGIPRDEIARALSVDVDFGRLPVRRLPVLAPDAVMEARTKAGACASGGCGAHPHEPEANALKNRAHASLKDSYRSDYVGLDLDRGAESTKEALAAFDRLLHGALGRFTVGRNPPPRASERVLSVHALEGEVHE